MTIALGSGNYSFTEGTNIAALSFLTEFFIVASFCTTKAKYMSCSVYNAGVIVCLN